MLEISSLAFLEIQKLPTFVRLFSILLSQVTHCLPRSVLASHSALILTLTEQEEEEEEAEEGFPSPKAFHLPQTSMNKNNSHLNVALKPTKKKMCHSTHKIPLEEKRRPKKKKKFTKPNEEGANY